MTKVVQVLEKAETDTEKFAALFLVPKLVKGADCDKNARMHLVEAMGYSFLGDDSFSTTITVLKFKLISWNFYVILPSLT